MRRATNALFTAALLAATLVGCSHDDPAPAPSTTRPPATTKPPVTPTPSTPQATPSASQGPTASPSATDSL
ncbi:hypothetical protein [Streptomyces sp. NPDC002692]